MFDENIATPLTNYTCSHVITLIVSTSLLPPRRHRFLGHHYYHRDHRYERNSFARSPLLLPVLSPILPYCYRNPLAVTLQTITVHTWRIKKKRCG